MSSKVPNFLFHIPHTNTMLDYKELEQRMRKRNAPEIVKVIDNNNKKRLGSVPSTIALLKFK